MHTPITWPRAGAAFVLSLAMLAPFFVPQTADAASRTSRYSSSRSYESSDFRSHSSSRGYSSAIQKKIDALPKKKAESLPIPVVLGVHLANLTKNFGDPRDSGARTHEGLDIMAPQGAFVASPTEAVVTKVGTGDSAGNYVYTVGPGGETFAYMHLDSFADGIKAGTELEAGSLIGYVGNTGNAAGGATHLHFEMRDGRTPTDPYLRLTHEFTNEERIIALTDVVNFLIKESKKNK